MNNTLSFASRRDGFQILVDILNKCVNTANKTRIVYSTNLNFKIIQKYLEFLLKKGLLEAVPSQEVRGANYRTTNKGRELLENYKKLVKLL